MKKFLIIIVILIALGGVYYLAQKNSSTTDVAGTPSGNTSSSFHPDPSNATFNFDDGPITLSNGKNETPITPGSALTEETDLLDTIAYGDINADGKNDTVLLLARYGAGSGTFIYLAAYVSGPVTYKGSSALFVGDRIAPQSITISGETVTLKYLDRKPDEGFAAEPTVSVSKQFVYRNGEFQEK